MSSILLRAHNTKLTEKTLAPKIKELREQLDKTGMFHTMVGFLIDLPNVSEQHTLLLASSRSEEKIKARIEPIIESFKNDNLTCHEILSIDYGIHTLYRCEN